MPALGMLWLLAVLPGATPASTDESLAVTVLELNGRLGASRAALEAAVRQGLEVARLPLVEAGAPATYAVSGEIWRTAGSLRVRLRLARAADGLLLATEENECDVGDCEVEELARLSARELVRTTLGRRPTGLPGRGGEPRSAAFPATPPGNARSASVAAPLLRPRREPAARHIWPLFVAGAGVASAGAGVFLLKIHDDCAGRNCSYRLDTRAGGVLALGAGLALASLGAVFAIYDASFAQPPLALGAGASGLWIQGAF